MDDLATTTPIFTGDLPVVWLTKGRLLQICKDHRGWSPCAELWHVTWFDECRIHLIRVELWSIIWPWLSWGEWQKNTPEMGRYLWEGTRTWAAMPWAEKPWGYGQISWIGSTCSFGKEDLSTSWNSYTFFRWKDLVKIANFLALWHPWHPTLEPRVSLCRLTDSPLWVPHGEEPTPLGDFWQHEKVTLKRNDIVCTTKRHAY